MHQLLKRHNLSKLTQEKTDNLCRSPSIREIKSIMNNLPKQRAQAHSRWMLPVTEDIMLIPSSACQRESEMTSHLALRGQRHLLPKPDKDKKTTDRISNEHRCRSPQQNISKSNPTTSTEGHATIRQDLFHVCEADSTAENQSLWPFTATGWRRTNHMIISIGAKKKKNSIWKKPMVIHDKNVHQSRNREELP